MMNSRRNLTTILIVVFLLIASLSYIMSIETVPAASVSPTSLDLSTPTGTTMQDTVSITNDGDTDIGFQIETNITVTDTFPTVTLDSDIWEITTGTPEIGTDGRNTPSSPYCIGFNNGDSITSVARDTTDFAEILISFNFQRGGFAEEPDLGEYLYLEYLTDLSTWEMLYEVEGTGDLDLNFIFVTVNVPESGFHSNFRIRFRSEGGMTSGDDFLLDDVSFKFIQDVSWLDFSPSSGTILPSQATDITIDMDATELNPGLHQAILYMTTNDTSRPSLDIPINLTVTSVTHDLRVESMEVVSDPVTGHMIEVNATIFNQGQSDETGFTVELNVESTTEDSTTLTLTPGQKYNVSLSWTPLTEEVFDIQINVPAVTGETVVFNNAINEDLNVTAIGERRLDKTGYDLTTTTGTTIFDTLTIFNDGYADMDYLFGIPIGLFNYSLSDIPLDWTDISTSGTNTSLLDDDEIRVDLPFEFSLYNKTFSSLNIYSNGLITFEYINPFYEPIFPVPTWEYTVMILFEDWDPATGGGVYTEHLSSPERFLISWEGVPMYQQSGGNHFQIVLFMNGTIEFHYKALPNYPYSYVYSGINLGDGKYGTTYNGGAHTGRGFRFQRPLTTAFWVETDPKNGTIASLGQQIVDITGNATVLNPGIYKTNLTLSCTDPYHQKTTIPVNLTVQKDTNDIRVVDLNAPELFKLGTTVDVSADIKNQGLGVEGPFNVELMINGSLEDTKSISSLAVDQVQAVTFQWTPASAGPYTVEIKVPAVTGETVLFNNQINRSVLVRLSSTIWLGDSGFDLSCTAGTSAQDTLVIGNSGLGTLDYNLHMETSGTSNYTLTEIAYTWLDGTTGGTDLLHSDDDYSVVDLPFSFSLYGETYDKISICSNGWVSFSLYDNDIPNIESFPSSYWDDTIMVMGTDMDPSDGGGVYTKVLTSPNRFLITWQNVPHYNSAQGNSFQLVLYEDGTIDLSYNGLSGIPSSDWSVVVNKGDDVRFTEYEGSLPDGKTLRLNLGGPGGWLQLDPTSGSIPTSGQNNINLLSSVVLNPGIYKTNITIIHNDFEKDSIRVPVNLTVNKAPHDLRLMEMVHPATSKAGIQTSINATVLNQGTSAENTIQVRFLVDGVLKDTKQLSSLAASSSTEVIFGWTPMNEGTYELEVNITSVTGETFITNNWKTSTITVTMEPEIELGFASLDLEMEVGEEHTEPLLIENLGISSLNYSVSDYVIGIPDRILKGLVMPGRYSLNDPGFLDLNDTWNSYGDRPIQVDLFPEEMAIDEVNLSLYSPDVLIFYHDSFGYYSSSERNTIDDYIRSGHGLYGSCGTILDNGFLSPLFGLNDYGYGGWTPYYNNIHTLLQPGHPVFKDISSPFAIGSTSDVTVTPSDGESWGLNDVNGGQLISTSQDGMAAIIAYDGDWKSVYYTGRSIPSGAGEQCMQFLYNCMEWLSSQNVDCPWIELTNETDILLGKTSNNIDLSIDTNHLEPGFHNATVMVSSNDTDEQRTEIPINLKVNQAQHDLRVLDVDAPDIVAAGVTTTINVTLSNQGKSPESDVDIELIINGSVQATKNLASIDDSAKVFVNISWVPQRAGDFTLTIHTVPVAGENALKNNNYSRPISITGEASFYCDPLEIDVFMEVDDFISRNIILSNGGYRDMHFTALPKSAWMGLEPSSGIIKPFESLNLSISIYSSALEVGEYESSITISTNDPDKKTVIIPLNLTVVEDIGPFADMGGDREVRLWEEVTFDGRGSYGFFPLVNFTWSVDGAELFGSIVKYTFDSLGLHLVNLTVMDEDGNFGVDTCVVNVTYPPGYSAPVAAAGGDRNVEVGENISFNGSASFSSNPIVNWTWNISGMLRFGMEVEHMFQTPGLYIVTLTITDNIGVSGSDGCLVNVTDTTPPVAVAGEDMEVIQGTQVVLNGSLSTDYSGIVSWTWSIEDIELSGSIVSHWFNETGRFTVVLTVKDKVGLSAQDTINITVLPSDRTAPKAVIGDGKDMKAELGQKIQIYGTGSTDDMGVVNWSWRIDGKTLYGSSVEYVFNDVGIYQIHLNVTDAAGNWDTTFISIDIVDSNMPPVADFTFEPKTPKVDEKVTFQDASFDTDGSIADWTWSVDDGTTSEGKTFTHVFGEAGIYWVTLTVTDDWGASAIFGMNITVTEKPGVRLGPIMYDDDESVMGAKGMIFKDGEAIDSDKTDSDGFLEFDALNPGEYTCIVELEGQVVTFGFEVLDDGSVDMDDIPRFPSDNDDHDDRDLVIGIFQLKETKAITIGGERYDVEVISVDVDEGKAKVEIDGVPIELSLGVEASVDLDNDDQPDLYVTLIGFDDSGNPILSFRETERDDIGGGEKSKESTSWLLWTILIGAIFIVIVIGTVLFMRRRGPPQDDESDQIHPGQSKDLDKGTGDDPRQNDDDIEGDEEDHVDWESTGEKVEFTGEEEDFQDDSAIEDDEEMDDWDEEEEMELDEDEVDSDLSDSSAVSYDDGIDEELWETADWDDDSSNEELSWD